LQALSIQREKGDRYLTAWIFAAMVFGVVFPPVSAPSQLEWADQSGAEPEPGPEESYPRLFGRQPNHPV
jgi:hypothetical protein